MNSDSDAIGLLLEQNVQPRFDVVYRLYNEDRAQFVVARLGKDGMFHQLNGNQTPVAGLENVSSVEIVE